MCMRQSNNSVRSTFRQHPNVPWIPYVHLLGEKEKTFFARWRIIWNGRGWKKCVKRLGKMCRKKAIFPKKYAFFSYYSSVVFRRGKYFIFSAALLSSTLFSLIVVEAFSFTSTKKARRKNFQIEKASCVVSLFFGSRKPFVISSHVMLAFMHYLLHVFLQGECSTVHLIITKTKSRKMDKINFFDTCYFCL